MMMRFRAAADAAAPIEVEGLPLPLVVRRHARSRRMSLRLDEQRRQLRLTLPLRASLQAGLRWAQGEREWVLAQLPRLGARQALVPGATILFQGQEVTLTWDERSPRTPILVDDRLQLGGPVDRVEERVLRWLRQEAQRRLSAATARIAARAGVRVTSVRVGDARGRWGSCSAAGAIRYNWRLVMAPPTVSDWVVAHEVAHRVHMNHGAAFRALEAALYDGDVAAARLSLRRLSPRLRSIGRG